MQQKSNGVIMSDKKKNVALFIDYDNIRLGSKNKQLDLNVIVERVNEIGALVIGKSYITISDTYQGIAGLLKWHYNCGIEPIFTPVYDVIINGASKRKSLGDPMLFCDAMEILCEKQEIDVFVIVSSDKDMIPLLRHIAKKGKEVLIIGITEITADVLRVEYDRLGFVFEDYNTLTTRIKEYATNILISANAANTSQISADLIILS